jgi:GNAT superfamily N-acetyltransferase
VLESVTFRPLDPSEIAVVLDSWFKSWRTSPWAGVVPNHLAASTTRELVGGLIARGAKITVADFNGRVLGWICYEHKGEDTVGHFLYVKDVYRRMGLGTALVDYAIGARKGKFLYTHKTRLSRWVLPEGAVHAPEIGRRLAL